MIPCVLSWIWKEYSLVRVLHYFFLRLPTLSVSFSIIQDIEASATPDKHRWDIFISTSGILTNNTGTTYSIPFSPNSLLARVPVATFYHAFIRLTTMARDSPVMAFLTQC